MIVTEIVNHLPPNKIYTLHIIDNKNNNDAIYKVQPVQLQDHTYILSTGDATMSIKFLKTKNTFGKPKDSSC